MTDTPKNTAPAQGNPQPAAKKSAPASTVDGATARLNSYLNPQKAADTPAAGNKQPSATAGTKDKPAAKPSNAAEKDEAGKPPAKKTPPADKGADKPNKGAADGGQPEDEDVDGQPSEAEDDAQTDETEGDADEGAEDGQPEGDDADGQSEDGGESDPESLHTVHVDGEEIEVTYEELVSGYQREADYRKKTQELAREKREVLAEKEAIKDMPEKRKQYEEGAAKFTDKAMFVLAALEKRFMPQPPSQELLASNPTEYLKQKEAHTEALQFSAAVYNELRGLEAKRKEEHKGAVAKGRQELYKVLPEMADTAARQRLTDYIRGLGYTDAQMAEEADHRLFLLAEKARRWDALQERKRDLKPKTPVSKVVKSTTAPPAKKAVEEKQRRDAKTIHKKQGTVDTAAAALAKAGVIQRRT